jgi:hypothetical protein
VRSTNGSIKRRNRRDAGDGCACEIGQHVQLRHEPCNERGTERDGAMRE